MKQNSKLIEISKIMDHIFLSGVYPLDDDDHIIKDLNIKYILCCVDKKYVADIHNKIMLDNPDITILYLPYNDDTYQNLWMPNKDLISITSYMTNNADHDKLSQMMKLYLDKPMIEIGYHFIDYVVSNNQNILIHCMAGISRSVSLVIYYLMKKYHMSFDKAFEIVNNARSIANPNESFKAQLMEYDIQRDAFSASDADIIIKQLKSKSKNSDNKSI